MRIFSDANESKFKENLSKFDWTNELKSKTVDEAMSFFYQTITKAYNKSFPIVKLSRKRAKDKPWITSGLKVVLKRNIFYIVDSSWINQTKVIWSIKHTTIN